MSLDDKQRREIRQLMFVALYYLHAASGAAKEKHSSVTFGSLANEFAHTKDVVGELLCERTIISADLASAAMRLASVGEIIILKTLRTWRVVATSATRRRADQPD